MKALHEPPATGGQADLLLRGGSRAELLVRAQFSELMLQSREIEDQTRVARQGRQVQLWEALKTVLEACFAGWNGLDSLHREAFVREALAIKEASAREGQDLTLAALRNPLQAKATARVLLLGNNFLRTLDICLEALLRFPSQKGVAPKPLKTEVLIDWAVGGIREWAVHYPCSFEKPDAHGRAPQRLARVMRHYSTDRSIRSQISHKQIANIFMLRETTVAELERRALAKLRASFESGGEGDFDLSELAGG